VRIRTVLGLFVGLALVFALAAPAAAQGAAPASDGPLIGAGIAFNHWGDIEKTGTGFAVDFRQNIWRLDKIDIGGVGDFGYYHFGFDDGSVNLYNLMGGVRFTGAASPKIMPFGQFTLGMAHASISGCPAGDDCSESDFAIAPGFGVDFRIHPKLNIRAQIDFFVIMAEGDSTNTQRYWFGVSMPIGR
jgi:Outer membrane protein beta-barrel domain